MRSKAITKTAIIIDDHQLFSAGLGHVVEGLDGIDNVLCFSNPQTALETASADNVKMIICDLYIPGFDMFVWFGRFRKSFPKSSVIVISSSISRTDRTDSLNAGAHMYFEKHAAPEIVASSLAKILEDQPVEDRFLSRTAKDARDIGLTDKQIDILVHLARGLALKEIAIRFAISPETVKSHLSRIYEIIGVSGRSAASSWAKRHGLL